MIHIHRHVADDADTPVVAVVPQSLPLLHEDELDEPDPVDAVVQALRLIPETIGVPPLQAVRPLVPRQPRKVRPYGGIQGKIIQPPGILPAVPLEIPPVSLPREPAVGTGEDPFLERDHPCKIDRRIGKFLRIVDLLRVDETIVDHQLRTDQERVLRKAGGTAIGTVAIRRIGRVQGEDLPVSLSGPGKKIGETVCRGSEVADAEPRRESGDMQEHSAPPGLLHTASRVWRSRVLLPHHRSVTDLR